ncbi:Hypothetical predicted protein [Marmota monax]|uniref:Uncharacterized protein n=1 Tax=Marmota monax TaxID=9995 RepID=A0A5E4ABR3_MARMO|nr:hypothetical protein GHT09_010476 [Marmota monax]VTJ54733.1 Hypothetical predicted protein [Marmota monax]
MRSSISAGGGPGRSEPRRRLTRGSRGCGDGGRGGATGRIRLNVTAAAAAAAVAVATRSATLAKHGGNLCPWLPRLPHLVQLEELPASGTDGPSPEGVICLLQRPSPMGNAVAK